MALVESVELRLIRKRDAEEYKTKESLNNFFSKMREEDWIIEEEEKEETYSKSCLNNFYSSLFSNNKPNMIFRFFGAGGDISHLYSAITKAFNIKESRIMKGWVR